MLRIMALIGLVLVSFQAQAADNGVYLGAGAVQTDFGFANPDNFTPFDNKDNGYKLILGVRPLDSFGVELNYADHGRAVVPSGIVCAQFITVPCPADSNASATTLSAFAVGYLDFPLIDLFAKAGATSWDFKLRSRPAGSSFSASDSGKEFAWGAGAQAHFGSLAVRLEYEQLNFVRSEKLGTVSLSFLYTFL
jgi:opacity protein-like surface antigen